MKNFVVILSAIVFTVVFLSSCGPKACDCADIYNNKNAPFNKEYSPREINEGTKMQDDMDDYIEMTRSCVEKYGGKLSEQEEVLLEDAHSLGEMPKLHETEENAKKDCK
jgi:hypothetical protein